MMDYLGGSLERLTTPALCVDLEAFEHNVQTLARLLTQRGKAWRPHMKGHKTTAIAWRQMGEGAVGVTCARLAEAEVYAQAGIRSLLVAHQLASPQQWERAAALCRHSDLIICADHYAQVEPLSAVCRRWNVTCRVLIEVNIGMNRAGTRPGKDAVELAQAVDRLPHLELLGLMGYEGHVMRMTDQEKKRQKLAESMAQLQRCRELFVQHGLRCDVVSAGGTGTWHLTSEYDVVTEVQAGGGVFGDLLYTREMQVPELRPALTVLTTITSRPEKQRAIIDAGRKAINAEIYWPEVKGVPGAKVASLSAEHGILELHGEAQNLRIGDRLELWVGYADFTTAWHAAFYGIRQGRIEAVWPIVARGW
ncbi:MAG: alanine racemase [Planctomycetaceae bacterium]|nr:MAG: alanine racemase [Planctomycetaceae bacterium]